MQNQIKSSADVEIPPESKVSESKESEIYEKLVEIVVREIRELTQHRGLDDRDLVRLDRLAKIYATLKDDLRADLKEHIKRESQPQ